MSENGRGVFHPNVLSLEVTTETAVWFFGQTRPCALVVLVWFRARCKCSLCTSLSRMVRLTSVVPALVPAVGTFETLEWRKVGRVCPAWLSYGPEDALVC